MIEELHLLSFDYFLLLRVLAAALLGALVGIERSRTGHEAGIRTHMILCIGAAGAMVLSECISREMGGDVMRFGAQVISGVGFLGAGNIILNRNRIKGITTAAGLWTTAIMGLVIGAGYYVLGVLVALLELFATFGLHKLSLRLQQPRSRYILCIPKDDRVDMQPLFELLEKENISILGVRYDRHDANFRECTKFKVELPEKYSLTILLSKLEGTVPVCEVINYDRANE